MQTTTNEIRNMQASELQKELATARHTLAVKRMEVRTEKSKAVHEVKELKAYISRILTVLNEKATDAIIEEAKPLES